jgi:hypothetical protein
MNPALPRVLNQLVQETLAFLAIPEPDLAQWEAYVGRRAELLAELQRLDFSPVELTDPTLAALRDEVLQQQALVVKQGYERLAQLGGKIQTLEIGRRALHGYGASSTTPLFERNV